MLNIGDSQTMDVCVYADQAFNLFVAGNADAGRFRPRSRSAASADA